MNAIANDTAIRPGRFWYGVAAVLFLVLSALSIAVLYGFATLPPLERVFFLTPGEQTIRVDKAGTHTLVYESRIMYAGSAFHTPARLPPETSVNLVDTLTDEPVPVRLDLGHPLIRFNPRRNVIGTVRIPEPGSYRIAVATPEDEPLRRVFSFGPSQFWNVVAWLSLWALINFMAFFFGPALAILVLSRRIKARRRLGLC